MEYIFSRKHTFNELLFIKTKFLSCLPSVRCDIVEEQKPAIFNGQCQDILFNVDI